METSKCEKCDSDKLSYVDVRHDRISVQCDSCKETGPPGDTNKEASKKWNVIMKNSKLLDKLRYKIFLLKQKRSK